MKFPLVYPYPMHEDPPSDRELKMYNYAVEKGWPATPPRDRISIFNPLQHVLHALNNFSTNVVSGMLERYLEQSDSYRNALKLMPNLSSVKGLWNYRNRHGAHDQDEVIRDLEAFGMPLGPGQTLFHGGIYPRNEITDEPLVNFITDRPLSSSLCAQVAAVHSLYHDPKDVWIITVKESSATKAFFFSNSRRQNLGHEIEVLISPGAKINLINVTNHKEYSLYEVELV